MVQVTGRQYLEQCSRPFETEPRYYKTGDFLTCFLSERECYAKRINSLLTVFLDQETNELVGCKVKGITRIIKNVRIFLSDGTNSIDIVLLVAMGADFVPELSENLEKFRTAKIPDQLLGAAA